MQPPDLLQLPYMVLQRPVCMPEPDPLWFLPVLWRRYRACRSIFHEVRVLSLMSLHIILIFNDFVFLPSVRPPFRRSRFGIYGASTDGRQSLSRCFFLPITLSEKGRICRKCTSKRREQARPATFAPVKSTRRREGRRKKK